jgi:nicotinamidase-related amidase
MLDQQRTILIVIDVQGNLARVVNESEKHISNIIRLIKGMQALDIPILLTTQVPHKIGSTITEVAALFTETPEIPRLSFSAMRTPEVVETLKQSGRTQVLLCGFETHICLYQTSLDLLAAGYEAYLGVDVTSSRAEANKTVACTELGALGVHLVTTEMIFFSLLKGADHPKFKTIANLIK